MSNEFQQGDHVSFNIGGNVLEGTIEGKLTEPAFVGDRIAHASEAEPRYAVHYDKTGTDFIRTADKLNPDPESFQHSGSSGYQNQYQNQNQQSADQFQVGDTVSFNIGKNELQGTVSDVITDDHTKVGGRYAHGSEAEPKLAIHYDPTGADLIRNVNTVHQG